MVELHKCPTFNDVVECLPNISETTIRRHMEALDGAKGLPYHVSFDNFGKGNEKGNHSNVVAVDTQMCN
jgi:hypothetical protein